VQERSSPRCARVAIGALAIPATALACLVAARAGAADPPAVVLEWQGPEDCQASPRVASEVRRLVGAERARARLGARVKIERRGRRWHVVLATEPAGHGTTRELDAESCGAAADAVAVILALTLDPSRALGGEEDAAPPPVDAARAPDAPAPPSSDAGGAPDAVTESPPAADAGEVAPFPIFLFANGASDTGSLPRAGLGFGGGVGALASHFELEATLAYFPTVKTELEATPARGGSFTMLVADLRGCVLAEASVFSFGPCAGGELTRMHAEAFGVTTPIAASAVWGSVVAGALVRARISRLLSPRLSAGATFPFARPTFEVEGLGAVHRPAAIALQIAGGMEVHF
jgi:hypothetical protein